MKKRQDRFANPSFNGRGLNVLGHVGQRNKTSVEEDPGGEHPDTANCWAQALQDKGKTDPDCGDVEHRAATIAHHERSGYSHADE